MFKISHWLLFAANFINVWSKKVKNFVVFIKHLAIRFSYVNIFDWLNLHNNNYKRGFSLEEIQLYLIHVWSLTIKKIWTFPLAKYKSRTNKMQIKRSSTFSQIKGWLSVISILCIDKLGCLDLFCFRCINKSGTITCTK